MSAPWHMVGWLAVEVALIVVITLLVTWRMKSVIWQRTLWQAGLIALVGVLVVEFAALTPVFTRKEVQADAPVVKIEAEAMEVRTQVNAPVEIAATELSIPVPAEPLVGLEPVVTAPVKQEVVLIADRMAVSTEAKAEGAAVKNSADKFPMGLALLLFVWTVGSLVLAGRLLVGRFLLLRFCARSQSVYDVRLFERVQGIAGKLGLKQGVQVLETERIQTPVVFGLFRLTIALPVGFAEKFERRQQEAILAHELAHLAARDPLWYLLADALVSVLWWHPLVWVARARLQVTSELAADEACVLAEQGPETLAECLVTIAKEMHGQGALESIGIEGSGFRSRLGQRVERLLNLSAEVVAQPAKWRMRLVKAGMPVVLVMVLLMASGWVRRDQSAPWSGLLGGAWNVAVGILKTEEMDIRRDPRPRLVWVPKVLEVDEVLKVSSRISGRVMLDGVAPKEREIQVGNPELAKLARKPFLTRFYVVSEDKGLGDTVVYIKKGLEGKKFAVPEDTMVFTQRGLEWHPYIGALRAGQKVRFTMETPIMQSVHFSPKNPNNKEWNRALIPLETTIDHPELMARVMSDTMPWLYAYISVFEHPYFAVTDKEGKFEFPESLPAGRYTLGVLHRRAGEMELEIEVEAQSGSGLVITLGEKKSRKVETRLAMNGDVGKLVGKRELNEDTEKKLDELVLPELSFDGLPLEAALQQLTDESKRLDPQKKGLEFNHGGVLSGKTKISIDHSGNAWAEPGGNIKQRVEDVVVTVKPARKGLSFRQALEAICNGASVPSRFTIRNGGVFVSVMLNEEGTKLAMNGEGKTLLTPNPDVRTNVVQATSRRSLILSKLEQIVLKEVFFDGVPLAEVVRSLRAESVKLDPEGNGISFIINTTRDYQADENGLDPLGAPVPPAVDLEKMMIKINPPLKNLRMIDALDAITKVATPVGKIGLAFTVGENGVVFWQTVIDPPQLYTRIFKVDKEAFLKGVEKHTGKKVQAMVDANRGGSGGGSVTNSNVHVLAREYFAAVGVDLRTNSPAGPTTQIFFNDRTGVLMARASLRDLELIAQGLEAIGAVVDNTPIPSGISSAGSSVVRFYKFEAAAYVRGLEKVTGKKVAEMSAADLAAQVNGGRGTTNQHHVQWHQIELLTREFLMAQGADLSTGNFGLTYPQKPEDVQEVRWNIGGAAKAEEVFQRSGQKILAAGKQDGEVAPLGRATNQVAIKLAAESVTRFIKFEIVPFVRGLEKLTGKKVNELAEAELAGLADPVERQNVTNMHHARWKQIFMLSKEFLTSQGADMTSGSIMPMYPKEPEALEARWLVNTTAANLEVVQKGIEKILEAGKDAGAAVTTGTATNQIASSVLVQDAKLLYELRRLEEAEVKLREVIKREPTNSTAYYYMNLIQEARYSDLARKRDYEQRARIVEIEKAWEIPKARAGLATPNPYVRTNAPRTLTKAQQRIEAKLDGVVIKEAFFDGLPLAEVVRFLREESIKQDPEKVGINLVINSKLDDQPGGAGGKALRDPLGAPLAPVVSPGPQELNMVLVTINPPLKNLTMRQMLSAITNATAQVGKHGLDYKVEDFGVTFRQRVIDPPQLFTRIFKIDPATFAEGLQRVWANSGRPANSSTNLQDMWREFIRHAGVTTDTNSMTTNQIFYNDKTGVLMVRASLKDLEVIQTAIEVINIIPPLVQMTGQYVEMSIEAAKALGFNPVDSIRTRVTPAWIDETRLVVNIPTNNNVRVLGADAPPRMRTISEGQRDKLLTDLKAGGYHHALMQAGEQATVDGRQAQVGFATDFETALVADKRQGGRVENWASHMGVIPSFLARPKVYPDGETIRLDWVACLTQVLGHDNSPTSFRNPVMAKDPVPNFRVRYSSSTTILKIGETLLVEGGLVEKNGDTWVTVLMLTPYLIDPAGNRLK